MYKIFLAVILILQICQSTFAQTPQPMFQQPQLVITSPEAASLYAVKDVPIDYSSGTANIDIPIYTIKDGNISIPISITYNTSGIRVQDVSGVIGLGWNLNVGGEITVKQDVYRYGYVSPYNT